MINFISLKYNLFIMSRRSIIPDKIDPKIWRKSMGNRDDIILYALNSYSPMGRTEFISDGKVKRMNKNTFHDHAKELIKKGYIERYREGQNSFYKITSSGETELSRRLINYELDFEARLEIEDKKNKSLIKRLSNFFKENTIKDEEIQLEYIKLSSVISHEKLKEIYSEDQFNKLLLFLILNHPRFYPNYSISIEDFREKYNKISKGKLTLNEIGLFIDKVIDEKIYEVNFHKLKLESGNEFYFVENSEYGELFKITVDNRLRNLILLRNQNMKIK